MSDTIPSLLREDDELLSEDVQEIISYRPHWIVRMGISIFFLLLMLLLGVTWFIRYPDIINGSIRLVAKNMPKQINAKTEGKLEKLLISNEQEVMLGQPVAYLQSTAKHDQVISLQKWINHLVQQPVNRRIGIIIKMPLPQFYSLGELQSAYQQFQTRLIEAKQILAAGYYEQKKAALQRDLQYLTILQSNTLSQQKLFQEDYNLQKVEFRAKELLLKEKVIALLEFNQDKSKLISKEQSLEQIQAQLINNRLSIENKEKEIMDLQKSIFDTEQQFHSTLLDFKSKIEDWMQKYILIAPENGKVIFASTLQENQLLTFNQELFYIQPIQTSYYGELMAAQKGLGKIKTGQRVMIKVESYPSDEFGYINGVVDYISNIPNRRDSFIVKVNLPKGLLTTYNKNIYFRNNLLGQGEIITNERRLLERFLGQLKEVVKR